MYGLFQPPTLWHDTTDKVQLGIGFTPTLSDDARVYTHDSIDTFVVLSFLADNILITVRNKESAQGIGAIASESTQGLDCHERRR